MAVQNPTPDRSIHGSATNNGIDGKKNQKVLIASSATRCSSRVSRHNHSIARSEVSGSEATRPPQLGYRRAISETAATITPDNAALMKRYSTARALPAPAAQKKGRPPEKGGPSYQALPPDWEESVPNPARSLFTMTWLNE